MTEWESFYLSLPSEVLRMVEQKAEELHFTPQAVICDIVENYFDWKEKVEFSYKGYEGEIDLNDVVTFKGTTIEEAEQAFRDSIDDYLEFCEELDKKPN